MNPSFDPTANTTVRKDDSSTREDPSCLRQEDTLRFTAFANQTISLSATPLTPGQVPTRILLAPWGAVESDSGSFVVDEESARLILAAFEGHGTDLPIDYEHQPLGGPYAAPDGRAPAAGWIKRIECHAGEGVFGEIEWTRQAQELLAQKAYRYLSPVAVIRQSDRKLVAIHSAALTNKPAIVGMTPIVNRILVQDGSEPQSLVALRSALGLSADCDVEELCIAAQRALAGLRKSATARHIEQRVSEAMCSGKLTPAQQDWARALMARDESLFEQWLESAPVLVRRGAIPAPTSGAHSSGRLAIIHRARAEFRSHPALSALTSEDAYIADCLRSAGMDRDA